MNEGWTDFDGAVAGAAAALAGLVVVAVSVNVQRILKYPQLPARAGAAVGQLVAVLLVSIVALAPQSAAATGVEVALIGLVAWSLQVSAVRISIVDGRRVGRPSHEAIVHIVRSQAQGLPFIVGGVLLVLQLPAAPFVLLGGVVASIALSMYETWILLVEILR